MTFPVTESTLSAIDLGKFIQQKYNVSSNTICKLFRTGMNHSYHVSDGGNKFILRIYNLNWRTRTEISEELRLLNHLKQNAIDVAYPIADKEGNFIQEINAPEGKRYGVLFSFANGKKISKFNTQVSYHVGRTMARMHKVTQNFELNRVTYNSKTLLTDSLTRTKSFFANPSDEMNFVESVTHYLKVEFEKIKIHEVRLGAVHLDIWFDNMHVDEEDKVTIFDFDFCGNGWLFSDIAYFIFQLYNTNQAENEYELKVESFFKGYEEVRGISAEERRLMPLAGIGIFLFYLGNQCITFDSWSNIFLNEDHLKRFVGSMKRWVAYNKIELSLQN